MTWFFWRSELLPLFSNSTMWTWNGRLFDYITIKVNLWVLVKRNDENIEVRHQGRKNNCGGWWKNCRVMSAVMMLQYQTVHVYVKHQKPAFSPHFLPPLSFRTWSCWRRSFVPGPRALTLQRPGTVGGAAAALTRPAHAHPRVSAGRNAAGSCGTTWAQWRRTLANSMLCSFAWTSLRKSCWKRESKTDGRVQLV